MENRQTTLERVTKETNIRIMLNLDGTGICNVNTGVGFFDHMIESFSRHGLFDIDLTCDGDLNVDCHHTIEDIGIVLGQAIAKALGDKQSIKRYGNFLLPMDETLVLCAVDLAGRPYFSSDITYTVQQLGDLDTEMLQEFFYAVSHNAGMNLHFKMLSGTNNHHIAEACFKAFAKALDMAVSYDERVSGVWSTKGSL